MKVIFEVISGHAGPCLSIGDGDSGHRLSGPKPLGGGSVIHSFEVCADELQRELNSLVSIFKEKNK